MRVLKKSYLITIGLVNLLLVLLAMAGCSTSPSTGTATTMPAVSPTATTTSPATTTPATTTPAAKIELNISSAASLTNVLKEIDALYTQAHPNVTLTANFASSGTLQQQIEQGAPADVFISAAAAQMDNLQKEGLILTDTRQNLLTNTLVLIVPSDSKKRITSFSDLTLDKVTKVAIGDPKSGPAGAYALQVFDELGITAQVQPKEVLAGTVNQVLTYVVDGDVDAGIVFATDALSATKTVVVVAIAPADVNAKIVYPVAVTKGSKNPDAAKDYLKFLFSDQAKAIFVKYGFTMVNK